LSTPEFRVARVDAPALYELRRRVLRGNDPAKSVADPRDAAPTTLHFGGYLDGVLVVSATFLLAPSPTHEGPAYQLRYMATDVAVQGRGYASAVMATAIAALRERGAHQLWANARDSALGFYVKTGWRVLEGSEHLSPETQLPHTVIVMDLAPTP